MVGYGPLLKGILSLHGRLGHFLGALYEIARVLHDQSARFRHVHSDYRGMFLPFHTGLFILILRPFQLLIGRQGASRLATYVFEDDAKADSTTASAGISAAGSSTIPTVAAHGTASKKSVDRHSVKLSRSETVLSYPGSMRRRRAYTIPQCSQLPALWARVPTKRRSRACKGFGNWICKVRTVQSIEY